MKKEYKSPEMDIETFDISSAIIITTSGFSFEEDDNTY